MSTKAKYFSGILNWYDSVTFERVINAAPVQMVEDFLGLVVDTTVRWATHEVKTAGTPTHALVANAANGKVRLALDATSEAQLEEIDGGDVLNWVVGQGPVFEAVAALHTLPTGAAVVVLGLGNAYNATLASVNRFAWFRWDASGTVTVEHSDGTHTSSKVATGVTALVADGQHTFRIDLTDSTSVKFYVDGNQVAGSTTFNMSASATQGLQPIARIQKGVATDVGAIDIDKITVYQKRS